MITARRPFVEALSAYIRGYHRNHHLPPTIGEIATAMGIDKTATREMLARAGAHVTVTYVERRCATCGCTRPCCASVETERP